MLVQCVQNEPQVICPFAATTRNNPQQGWLDMFLLFMSQNRLYIIYIYIPQFELHQIRSEQKKKYVFWCQRHDREIAQHLSLTKPDKVDSSFHRLTFHTTLPLKNVSCLLVKTQYSFPLLAHYLFVLFVFLVIALSGVVFDDRPICIS